MTNPTKTAAKIKSQMSRFSAKRDPVQREPPQKKIIRVGYQKESSNR